MAAVRATFLLGEVERPHTTIRNRVVEASRCSIVRDARIEKKKLKEVATTGRARDSRAVSKPYPAK